MADETYRKTVHEITQKCKEVLDLCDSMEGDVNAAVIGALISLAYSAIENRKALELGYLIAEIAPVWESILSEGIPLTEFPTNLIQ